MVDESEKPLREMDLAFLEMFGLVLDILVRIGVPREEFEQQFKRTLERVSSYPKAKHIIEGLAKIAASRAGEFESLGKVRLSDPPQGRA